MSLALDEGLGKAKITAAMSQWCGALSWVNSLDMYGLSKTEYEYI